MRIHLWVISILLVSISVALWYPKKVEPQSPATSNLQNPRETHLSGIKQLTFEGENAEAYFSIDGKKLIFQRAAKADGCDQIFSINIDGSGMKLLSNGEGKTTCSYFTPDNKSIIYASTFRASPICPPKPDYSRGY